MTYLITGEGGPYLAAVLEFGHPQDRRMALREHMRTELTLTALIMATQRLRPAAGLICQSDRRNQYAAAAYGKQLAAMGAVASMSRPACRYDNSPMETFFSYP